MILAVQRDDKLVIFKRDGDVDTDVEILSADDADRFANAILATIPRVRETDAKGKRQKLTSSLAEIDQQRSSIISELSKLD